MLDWHVKHIELYNEDVADFIRLNVFFFLFTISPLFHNSESSWTIYLQIV